MRLIDADELKEDLRQYFSDGVLDGISARLAFNQILHDIDNAPTADDWESYSTKPWKEAYERGKAERPPGEWMKKVDDVGFISYICSSCGFELELEDCSDSYYCTNCGAKMKERKNE